MLGERKKLSISDHDENEEICFSILLKKKRHNVQKIVNFNEEEEEQINKRQVEKERNKDMYILITIDRLIDHSFPSR